MSGGPGAGGGDARHLVVATIRKPHGVRGELVLALDTDRPGAVFRRGRQLLLGDAHGRPIGGSVTVERSRPFKDGLLVKLVEHAGLTPEVEALRGRSLLIDVQEAAPAAPDEVHYRDLVGMKVLAGEVSIGEVEAVAETAGGELLVVRRPGRGDLLLPFVAEWVKRVDREGKVLVIEPPEGMLEL